jgi:hypothetical protein
MNSDSIFENEFFQKHQGIFTLLTTFSLAFIVIFWLYRGLKSNDRPGTNTDIRTGSANGNVTSTKISKRRISINANNLLFKDINNIDTAYVYQILEKFSKFYDIYLIILIDENQKIESILEKFNDVTIDKIVLKHVSYKIHKYT